MGIKKASWNRDSDPAIDLCCQETMTGYLCTLCCWSLDSCVVELCLLQGASLIHDIES